MAMIPTGWARSTLGCAVGVALAGSCVGVVVALGLVLKPVEGVGLPRLAAGVHVPTSAAVMASVAIGRMECFRDHTVVRPPRQSGALLRMPGRCRARVS